EELLTLEKLKNIIEYQKLGHEFASLMYETLHPRNESEIQKYQEIANHFLLSSEKNALTYQSKLSFYWITSSYAQVKGDFECYYENSKKCLETIETNKLQLEENPIKYLNALHNFLGTCVNLKKYEEVPETLKKIRSLSKNLTGNLQIQIFARTYPIELIMYIDTAEFEKCIKLIGEIDFELKKYWENLKKIDKIYFAYLICYSFYAVGNYSKALGWINKILNDKETEIREDLYCFSRILNLIIHFELEDYELLEHIVKSTHDFLVRRKKIYKFETILLNFLKKFSQVKNNKELLELFKELKTEILPLTEDIFEQKALSYFDFISWLDSKIEEKSFSQVVKNKLKQHS
ncbi:hypothetical protein IT568_09190, partial [bacterium]|nr:hypothetical protein [bacterium]